MDTYQPQPTSAQLCAAVPDLTYRQLDWWVRNSYVDDGLDTTLSGGSGSRRTFTALEVLRVRQLAYLVSHGHHVDDAVRLARGAAMLQSGEWTYRHPVAAYSLTWRLPPSQTEWMLDTLVVDLP